MHQAQYMSIVFHRVDIGIEFDHHFISQIRIGSLMQLLASNDLLNGTCSCSRGDPPSRPCSRDQRLHHISSGGQRDDLAGGRAPPLIEGVGCC